MGGVNGVRDVKVVVEVRDRVDVLLYWDRGRVHFIDLNVGRAGDEAFCASVRRTREPAAYAACGGAVQDLVRTAVRSAREAVMTSAGEVVITGKKGHEAIDTGGRGLRPEGTMRIGS